MFRSLHWLRASLFACFVAALLAAGGAAGAATGSSERLALAVVLNGAGTDGEPIVVRRDGGEVRVAAADLRRLGVPVPAGDGEVALGTVPGLNYDIDTATQTLRLAVRLARERVAASEVGSDGVPVSRNGWGGVLNYDAVASRSARGTTVGALVEAVVYAPRGHAFANALARTDSGPRERAVRRLDSGVTFADPARARRLTLGDFVNAGNAFSRPVRMAGLKLGTDFGLRPDLVTFPLPSISGQAAVPSSVDLIVNGSRVASRSVRAGDFALADVPVQTGLNTVSVAVRDALGRQTVRSAAIYASASLLRPGLSAWSLEAGRVRTGFGLADDRYRGFVASGTGRAGITPTLTLQGRFEGGAGVAVAGGGPVLALGRWGAVEGNAMLSRRPGGKRGGGTGTQLSLAWERIARPISASARYTRSSDGFVDIARRYGSPTRRDVFTANIGFDLRTAGQLSASIVSLGRGQVERAAPATGAPAAALLRSRLLVGTYSVRVAQRLNLVANAGGDPRRGRSFFASIGINATLGSRSSAYAAVNRRAGGASLDTQLVRSALLPGDWGYRAQASLGTLDRFAGGVEYLGDRGHVAAEVETLNGSVAGRVAARGAMVLAGGGIFLADRITQGFAIVDSGEERRVPVYRDNRLVGDTGRRGKLLVANLPAYVATKLAVDPTTLDAAVAVDHAELHVKPAERAGVRVRPGVHRDRSLVVRLVDAAGRPLPAGWRALVNDAAADSPVGFDGDLYVPAPRPTNVVRVIAPGGEVCAARFALPADARGGARIGPLACLPSDRIAARD